MHLPRTLSFAAALLTLTMPALAYAQAGQTTQAAYVERRGLLEVDARCQLLTPQARAAIEIGAAHARGLLRNAGWNENDVIALDAAATNAAARRACADARNTSAAADAESTYAAWRRLASMEFAGRERTWTALRIPDPEGWLLRQDANGGAIFGVRQTADGQHLAIKLTMPANQPPAAAATLLMRDRTRTRLNLAPIPGQASAGLASVAPYPASARRFLANGWDRNVVADEQRTLVFSFPDAAFIALLALDPREAVEIRVGDGPNATRFFVEVGDLAAARAFLALDDATRAVSSTGSAR